MEHHRKVRDVASHESGGAPRVEDLLGEKHGGRVHGGSLVGGVAPGLDGDIEPRGGERLGDGPAVFPRKVRRDLDDDTSSRGASRRRQRAADAMEERRGFEIRGAQRGGEGLEGVVGNSQFELAHQSLLPR